MSKARKTIDDPKAWDSRKLGHDERFVAKAAASENARVDESLGLQMISIRLPKRLIDQLKIIAKHSGIGYQPLMRDVLSRYARGELIQVLREQDAIATLEGRRLTASRLKTARPRRAA
jgi:hypothetical protein